jgi:hypothetical protein
MNDYDHVDDHSSSITANNCFASFEALTAVTQVDVFWVLTPCSIVVGYQRFRSPCCLHLQGEVGILPTHYTASQPSIFFLDFEGRIM